MGALGGRKFIKSYAKLVAPDMAVFVTLISSCITLFLIIFCCKFCYGLFGVWLAVMKLPFEGYTQFYLTFRSELPGTVAVVFVLRLILDQVYFGDSSLEVLLDLGFSGESETTLYMAGQLRFYGASSFLVQRLFLTTLAGGAPAKTSYDYLNLLGSLLILSAAFVDLKLSKSLLNLRVSPMAPR